MAAHWGHTQINAVAYLTNYSIAKHHLNKHDFLRVEICERRGKFVTRISRWKHAAGKTIRTGESFEFSARHINDLIAALVLADGAPAYEVADGFMWVHLAADRVSIQKGFATLEDAETAAKERARLFGAVFVPSDEVSPHS